MRKSCVRVPASSAVPGDGLQRGKRRRAIERMVEVVRRLYCFQ